jgi:4-diphosphocytidyl-2-C-methyl-D-erythritol kinase
MIPRCRREGRILRIGHAYRAAEVFLEQERRRKGEQEKKGGGVKIHIEKKIPMAAGLAGGSADAAAVLYGMSQLSSIVHRPSSIELLELAAQVGSDVPFCLTGGTCLIKGRGEVVEKLEPWPKTYFVLVCPDIQISAKWAYEEFDRMHLNIPDGIKNDLEPVAVSRYELITEIKDKLLNMGCSEAQMSGSGASVFGMVRHKAEAEEVFGKIKGEYPTSFLVETVDRGVEII